MHIKEAVRALPQLESILKDEFDKRTWYRLMKFGEQASCYKGVPSVHVDLTAVENGERPMRFDKHWGKDTDDYDVLYLIKNK